MPVNRITPSSPAAFRLIMEGQAAFSNMEANGMKIDVPYLDRAIEHTGKVITEISEGLKQTEIYTQWRKRYREKTSLGSRAQLGEILFNVMGYPCPKENRTKHGRPKTDAKSMESVDHPFVKEWNSLETLKKSRSTFLVGLRDEVDENGFVHPVFNLHFASTYRSSCDSPNLQNQPIRDKRQAKLIRRSFIPRGPDFVLVEKDYSALEFRGAANFWHDPAMVRYASDPTLDIHRDMAMQCYLLGPDQWNKDTRGYAKNQFVFPILYGSYYRSCAKNLWSQIGRGGLKTKDGVGIYEHLASKGIRDLESYMNHIKGVEEWFNKKFPMWSTKKDEWWDKYTATGAFELQTGFVCKGLFSYNNLMNTPVQGPSFHCLLWSVTRINEWLVKNKMKSKIICQIHDSILADVHRSELDDYLEFSEKVMTRDVRDHWPWIVTTLATEVDIAETNWFEKKPLTAA